MSLTRNQIAICKRSYKNVATLIKNRDKLNKLITTKQTELENTLSEIEGFEAPIKTMTGGYTSEEVLNGTYDAAQEKAAIEEGATVGQIDASNDAPVVNNTEDTVDTTKDPTKTEDTKADPVEEDNSAKETSWVNAGN